MIIFEKGIFKDYDPKIISWDKPREREFDGRLVKGRPTKGYGSSSFEYAGKVYEPTTWTSPMYKIKTAAEDFVKEKLNVNVRFTFCLCGYYGVDGKGIPHHSDTVPTLDDLVVSISFGAPRLFEFLHYDQDVKEHTNTSEVSIPTTGKRTKVLYLLEQGDVLLFDGASQMRSTHAVPDLLGADERVNLTFRTGL